MKIKKYICKGVPVEIRIEEDTLSHKEKLYMMLELLKESIEIEYTPIVIENKDKEKNEPLFTILNKSSGAFNKRIG